GIEGELEVAHPSAQGRALLVGPLRPEVPASLVELPMENPLAGQQLRIDPPSHTDPGLGHLIQERAGSAALRVFERAPIVAARAVSAVHEQQQLDQIGVNRELVLEAAGLPLLTPDALP